MTTDLDVDLADDRVDQLLRQAATDLRATAARRAATLGAPRRRRRVLPLVIAVGATMVLLAALFVVVRDHRHTEPADPTRDLQWIIGDLPDGTKLTDVTPPGPSSGGTILPSSDLYATDTVPDGPTLRVYPPGDSSMFGIFGSATEITERTTGELRVALGNSFGHRIAAVTLRTGSWTFIANGMSDDELVAAAAGLQPADGTTSAFAPGSLPAGMHLVGSAPFAAAMPMLTGMGGAGPTSSSLQYTGGDAGELILTVGEPTVLNRALVTSAFSLTPATIDGHPGWAGSAGDARTVAWVRDGRLFVIFNYGSDLDLAELAASVRQPSVDEWHRLVAPSRPSADEETNSTVFAEVPSDTVPAETPETTIIAPPHTVPAGVRDVPVTLDVRAVTPNDVVVSTDATGVTSAVDVAVAAGVARYSGTDDAGGIPIDLAAADPQVHQWADPRGDGVLAITADTSATALLVTTTTGERYVVGLVSVPARPDVRFAAIVIPPRTFVSADLVDATGNILGELDAVPLDHQG